jgi:hypothetical protein
VCYFHSSRRRKIFKHICEPGSEIIPFFQAADIDKSVKRTSQMSKMSSALFPLMLIRSINTIMEAIHFKGTSPNSNKRIRYSGKSVAAATVIARTLADAPSAKAAAIHRRRVGKYCSNDEKDSTGESSHDISGQ